MRKYWKTVVILSLIIVGVSTYLVQTALASHDLPRFELEHKSGDESVVDNVSFSGAYVQKNHHNVMRFDGEQTTYGSESTFIEDMVGRHDPIEGKLIEKYRDFMRGQPFLYNNFYNGDDALVIVEEDWNYTGQSRAKLNVSYLNKETEDQLETVINVENAHFANVMEVQYKDGRIYIYVNYAEQNTRILREFIYDVEGKAIVSDKKVLETEETEGEEFTEVQKLTESVTYQPTEHMVIRATKVLLEKGRDGGFHESKREEKLYRYNIEKGELTELNLPTEEYGYANRFDGKYIYFEQPTDGQSILIKPYDLEKQEFMDSIELNQSDQEGRMSLVYEVNDQKLYTLNNFKVEVIDVTTGKTVYEGEIVPKEDVDLDNVQVDGLTVE